MLCESIVTALVGCLIKPTLSLSVHQERDKVLNALVLFVLKVIKSLDLYARKKCLGITGNIEFNLRLKQTSTQRSKCSLVDRLNIITPCQLKGVVRGD